MSVDTKQILENLEVLLTTKKFKEVKGKLKSFEKDEWLMARIAELASKSVSSNNVSTELATLTQAIDGIVNAPYVFAEPTVLGEFYKGLYESSFGTVTLKKYQAV